jgi:hypothetical protein
MEPYKIILGDKSYPVVVEEILNKVKNAKTQTLLGNDFLTDMYKNLNESATPMMTLKPFITGGESIAKQDATVKDVLEFCKKQVGSNIDLNFIINLCKEEHIDKKIKSGHPAPLQTLKDIESEFNQPHSIIEEGIKNGIFDKLESKLFNDVKASLIDVKDLKESNVIKNSSIIKYNPIGFIFEKNNKLYALCENALLSVDSENNRFELAKELIELNESELRLHNAISTLTYDIEEREFSLNENWDFKLVINEDASTFITSLKEGATPLPIAKGDIKKLFTESIELYESQGKLNNQIKSNYLKDADNFCMLVENFDKIINFDTLEVLRNLNESGSYVILDINNKIPEMLFGSKIKNTKLYESFNELSEAIQEELGVKISRLYESEIAKETEILNKRNNKIVALTEQQRDINQKIVECQKLKNLADTNSPAYVRLNEQEKTLSNMLHNNLQTLNNLNNKFSLYNATDK